MEKFPKCATIQTNSEGVINTRMYLVIIICTWRIRMADRRYIVYGHCESAIVMNHSRYRVLMWNSTPHTHGFIEAPN